MQSFYNFLKKYTGGSTPTPIPTPTLNPNNMISNPSHETNVLIEENDTTESENDTTESTQSVETETQEQSIVVKEPKKEINMADVKSQNQLNSILYLVPRDVLIYIFSFTSYKDLLRLSRVSTMVHDAANSDILWKEKINKEFPNPSLPIAQQELQKTYFIRLFKKQHEKTFIYFFDNKSTHDLLGFLNENVSLSLRYYLKKGEGFQEALENGSRPVAKIVGSQREINELFGKEATKETGYLVLTTPFYIKFNLSKKDLLELSRDPKDMDQILSSIDYIERMSNDVDEFQSYGPIYVEYKNGSFEKLDGPKPKL